MEKTRHQKNHWSQNHNQNPQKYPSPLPAPKAPLKKEHLRSERCAQLKLELSWNITEEKQVVHPFQSIGLKVLTKLDH